MFFATCVLVFAATETSARTAKRLKAVGNALSSTTAGRASMRPVVHWAVLGPFPVGKGELDGDPTEQSQGA